MNKKKAHIKQFSGIIILLLYVLALLPKVHHHEHDHEHHHHEHGVSFQEHLALSSACHNATYHGLVEDCGHDHVSEAEEDCLSCQILVQSKSSPELEEKSSSNIQSEQKTSFADNQQIVSRNYTHPNLRAPPVL